MKTVIVNDVCLINNRIASVSVTCYYVLMNMIIFKQLIHELCFHAIQKSLELEHEIVC